MGQRTEVSRSTRVKANDSCLSTTIEGESVILHMDQGQYYGFNEVGTEIWELTREPTSVDEIVQSVTEAYEVTEERCVTDTKELLEELIQKDLVRILEM